MASAREIKQQVLAIKNTQKITAAMQQVAASKMHKAQRYMQISIPYANKIQEVVKHVASSKAEKQSLYLKEHTRVKRVGYIVVSTDRGLCGGLNLNLFKKTLEHASQFEEQHIATAWCLFGTKARSFFHNYGATIVAYAANLGETPKLADLIGSIKVMVDDYLEQKLDRLYVAHNEFVNTMVQKPKIKQLLPLVKIKSATHRIWDYIYEPEPKMLLDALIMRYIETQVYQAVVDNIACEQVARMLAMKNATGNAKELIGNLQLIYNKARQAAITQEIAEIVAGAEAL